MRWIAPVCASLMLTSGVVAEQRPTAVQAVDICGGTRLSIISLTPASHDELGGMADVLERRLSFVPKLFKNVSVVEDTLQIDLPLSMGKPGNVAGAFLKPQFIAAYLTEQMKDGEGAGNSALSWDVPYKPGYVYVPTDDPVFTSDAIRLARVTYENGRYGIQLELYGENAGAFEQVTSGNIGRTMVVAVDNKMLLAATIQTAIADGQIVISGAFSEEDAQQKVRFFNTGALRHELQLVSSDVIPTSDPVGCATLFAN
jgi:hypothetical protein